MLFKQKLAANRRRHMEAETVRKSPLATMEQAATYLQVSTRSVTNYHIKGWLDARYIGRRRFFTWASLEKLAKTGARDDT
jgi:hypothetical protein